jgi:predicted ferric reductase
VVEINHETKDVRTIKLRPVSGEKLEYAPGQFAFTRFFSQGLSSEEHHFTLSSSPLQDFISFSIKESGDYTAQLGTLKVGDRAQIEGPYGVCSNVGLPGPFVFVAGGIGITPIISMLRTMRLGDNKQRSLLIYANRTPDDVAFKDELASMAQEGWLQVVPVYSEAEVEGAYKGYVTQEIIEKELQTAGIEFSDATYVLVGPPPMMDAVAKILRAKKVAASRVFTERFALR